MDSERYTVLYYTLLYIFYYIIPVPSLLRSPLWGNGCGGLPGGCKAGLTLKRRSLTASKLLNRPFGCLEVEVGLGQNHGVSQVHQPSRT